MANESDWQTALATLADVSGPLSHELQNVLNGIVLQAAIVGRKAPESEAASIAVFRTLALRAAELLNRVDTYRGELRPPLVAVNPGRVVQGVATRLRTLGAKVRTRMERRLPRLVTCASDLSRLLWLIGKNAVAAGARMISLQVASADDSFRFTVADDGPPLVDGQQSQLLSIAGAARPGVNDVEMAACEGLARRLRANFDVTPIEQGLLIYICMPVGTV